ncbi:MAG: SEFIR domain-containing protein [Methanoregula sp.]
MTSPPTVFISYSHDSPEHCERVLKLANRLRSEGIDVTLDQYVDSPPEGWPLWMDCHIREDDFILIVCSKIYLQRTTRQKEAVGGGLGAKFESYLTYQHIYNAESMNTRFIPILFNDASSENIPTPLQGVTHYRIEDEKNYCDLYSRLTNQPARIRKPPIGQIKTLLLPDGKITPLDIKISLAKLPSTSPILFGREKDLEHLDAGWTNPKINIITLIAWGGVGKTALINKWITQIMQENFHGAERVFGWSFFSQGSIDGRQVSSDDFVTTALNWFGDPNPSQGTPWDKGERLADLVKQKPTILILDGLEPLQYPPPADSGRLKDPALRSLLRELAHKNSGLVLLTSRLPIDDLKDFIGNTVEQIDLENLDSGAGAQYLASFGVNGPIEELQLASIEYEGHALALTLLGSFLMVVYGGDIHQRYRITRLADEQRKGAQVRRIMESYENWFKGKPELDILNLLSLFDKPIESEILTFLKEQPVILGITEKIHSLSPVDWQYALENLRMVRLVSFNNSNSPELLDCHPLIREYFNENLNVNLNKSYREAHSKLFDYYKSLATPFPKTLEAMAHHFSAVSHGCQSGRYTEAYSEIYFGKINRYSQYYITKILGAPSADLTMLSCFFNSLWDKPVECLGDRDKCYLLNHVGGALSYLGRFKEASIPSMIAIKRTIDIEDWRNASVESTNISSSFLAMGEMETALFYGKQGVQFSNRCKEGYIKLGSRAGFATVLHRAGNFESAEAQFRKAEDFQKRIQPKYPILYSSHGFEYCSLLLSQGKYLEAKNRASQTLKWSEEYFGSGAQDVALDNITLGQALYQEITIENTGDYDKVLPFFDNAIKNLREVGAQELLVQGLLSRGKLYCVMGDFSNATKDIDEASDLVERGEMHLYKVDCNLRYGFLDCALGKQKASREHLRVAKEMIDKMGYHQRDNEIVELETLLQIF